MRNIDWEQEWKDVQSGAMLSKCRVGDNGFSDYFDRMAEEYLEQVLASEDFYRSIVGYLKRERCIRKGDAVLDIASGPGTYTLPFAEIAGQVSAMDPAKGMLSVLMRETARRGLQNVRPICSRWEDYDGDGQYDLVFTALSPGITGPEAFMKLEKHSKRSCCYIGFGDGSNNELSDGLWELVMGESRKNRGFSIAYPFNLLCSKGRKPNVRHFMKESIVSEPCEEVIESNIQWLGMFTAMNAAKKKKVREHVLSLSDGGSYEHRAKQSLAAIYWDVPV